MPRVRNLKKLRRLALVAGLGVFACGSVFAQDADDEATTEAAAPAPEPADQAEIDELEPAVSSGALEAGVTRRQVGEGVVDELDLERTTITGNSELPKVLYIVPWKQADLGDLVGRPVNSLLDEVLEPVDRDVFRRQISYYDNLYGAEPAASQPEP